MKKWFIEHPSQTGESYLGHMRYALGIAAKLVGYSFHLTICCFAFIIHAVLPAVPVPRLLNLEHIGRKGSKFLEEGVERDQQREKSQ